MGAFCSITVFMIQNLSVLFIDSNDFRLTSWLAFNSTAPKQTETIKMNFAGQQGCEFICCNQMIHIGLLS